MVLLYWLIKAYAMLMLMSYVSVAQHVVSTNTCESLYKEYNVTCKSVGGARDNSCPNAFDGDAAKTQWVGVSAGSDTSMRPQLSVYFGAPRLSTGYVIVPGSNSVGHNYGWILLGSNDGKLGTILDSRDQEVS